MVFLRLDLTWEFLCSEKKKLFFPYIIFTLLLFFGLSRSESYGNRGLLRVSS